MTHVHTYVIIDGHFPVNGRVATVNLSQLQRTFLLLAVDGSQESWVIIASRLTIAAVIRDAIGLRVATVITHQF